MSKLIIQFSAIENPLKDQLTDYGNYKIEQSYIIQESDRGESKPKTIELGKNELIEFIYEDGTTWICDEDTLEELFPDINTINRSGVYTIPSYLEDRDLHVRGGILKKIALKLINIFVKNAVEQTIEQLAENVDRKNVDGKSGLYHLEKDFSLTEISGTLDPSAPYLLFIHGTASNIEGSFGQLKDSMEWNTLYELYPNRIIAFQHETLTKSPLSNALDLSKILPENIILDLVTSSRGGIIGDILTLYSPNNDRQRGFNPAQLQYLKKEDRKEDINHIHELNNTLIPKNITIRRFVRVGCPAGGTSLASKRLSTFLNVLTNILSLVTASAALGALKTLLMNVVEVKNNEEVLPGIEAQRPESPFIKALNHPLSYQTGEKLLVISSNAMPGFNLRALLIILSRAVFYGRNDLVVDTRSMYQGARRNGKILYHFEQDTDIHHLGYFRHSATRSKVLSALEPDLKEGLFKSFLQHEIPDTDRNAVITLFGGPGGKVFSDAISGIRPVLIFLPGIMGSVLSEENDTIWVDFWGIVSGKLKSLDINNPKIRANAIVKSSYGKFVEEFSKNYDVVTFPFDWRRALKENAAEFNKSIKSWLSMGVPIQIVAHSMGGVLVRDFIFNHPDTWQTLNGSKNFRVIYLGTPFLGSFRIPAVLVGKDEIIRQLYKIDYANTKKELLEVFVKFQGIHNLLPLTNSEGNDFALKSTWEYLKEAANEGDIPIMSDEDLNTFREYRDKVLKSMDSIDFTNMVYIAGKGDETPEGYEILQYKDGSKEVRFQPVTDKGDESVTWESGIPKKIKELKNVYYVNVTHGSLANTPGMFAGIYDILTSGKTNKFSQTEIITLQRKFIGAIPEFFDLRSAEVESTLLGLTHSNEEYKTVVTIDLSVSKGDLVYSQYPIFVGHFKGDGILSAEKAINDHLGGILVKRNSLGLYPEEIGESEMFFVNRKTESQLAKFKGSVVMGLGVAGEFSSSKLEYTFEQAIANYLSKKTLREQPSSPQNTGISTLIIGSGYGGLSLESSVSAIINGVNRANEKIKNIFEEERYFVDHIEFIENVEDKAISCFQFLALLEKENSNKLTIKFRSKRVKTLISGFRRRLTFENISNDWWNIITVTSDIQNGIEGMSFSYSSKGAKEDKRSVFVNSSILNDLIKTISRKNQLSGKIAKALFELLIPNEFKESFRANHNLIWILDEKQRSIPGNYFKRAWMIKPNPCLCLQG